MFSKPSKSLSQTKKAISERKRRANNKERKRHDSFVRDYISTKYKEIYSKCNQAFNQLLHAYPNKKDLTKTYRYLKWKRTFQNTTPEINKAISGIQTTEINEAIGGIQDVQTAENNEAISGIQTTEINETIGGIQDVQTPENNEAISGIQTTEINEAIGATQDVHTTENNETISGIQDYRSTDLTLDQMELRVNNIINELEQDNEITKYLSEFQQSEEDAIFW